MQTRVGIFDSTTEASKGVRVLKSLGFEEREIHLLIPGRSIEDIHRLPTEDTEQPGVGKVLGGTGGAILGAGAGKTLEEDMQHGVPKDEIFFYEEALRQGKTVLVVFAPDEVRAALARDVMEEAGAHDIDAARKDWWVGIREEEGANYAGEGRDFVGDEWQYRQGFQAALRPDFRGQAYHDKIAVLTEVYGPLARSEAFRRGYERGQLHNCKFSSASA
jgi:hypothetical protein